jgi:hypothetical protein
VPISKDFVLAGDATFTVEVPPQHRPPGGHPWYTYRVRHKEAEGNYAEMWFVSSLSGPDNTSDYKLYLGRLYPYEGQVALTAKSKITPESYRYRLLNRVLARVWAGDHAAYESAGFQVHHEGKCGRCGRKLTVPESVESGIGPECAKRIGRPRRKETASASF